MRVAVVIVLYEIGALVWGGVAVVARAPFEVGEVEDAEAVGEVVRLWGEGAGEAADGEHLAAADDGAVVRGAEARRCVRDG